MHAMRCNRLRSLISFFNSAQKLKFELKVCRMHYVDYITADTDICMSGGLIEGRGRDRGGGGGKWGLCNFHQLWQSVIQLVSSVGQTCYLSLNIDTARQIYKQDELCQMY